MLVKRDEMRFDFGGARWRLPRDREALGWIFSQFLYGEVTGIQCGHWLYRAPDLEAAQFFAQQSVEEMAHVQQFLRLLEQLGVPPRPVHRGVQFLATSFMGSSFPEHTCLEMAAGEGFVLMVLYALIDTVEDRGIVRVLEAATVQEEKHVSFGEQRTARAVEADPSLARKLLGLSLVSVAAVRWMARRVPRFLPMDHEVMGHMPAFLQRTCDVAELRLARMGVLRGRLSELGPARRAALAGFGYACHLARSVLPVRRRLTETYLDDPIVKAASATPLHSGPRSL
jgi:hypothetical protein